MLPKSIDDLTPKQILNLINEPVEIYNPIICRCGHAKENHAEEFPYECRIYMNATLGYCLCHGFKYPTKYPE